MDQIRERLTALRAEMKKQGLDAWMAPTNDFHGSEYIGDYFKVRKYLTGFTGTVGTAVVTMDSTHLWVDGRYFVQAEKQLAGGPVILQKSGEPGVPTVEEFLEQTLTEGQVLGLDGRVISAAEGRELALRLGKKGVKLFTAVDIVDAVWTDRPALSKSQAFFLSEDYVGESRASKLRRVRAVMAEQGAKSHLLTGLDDIAWLYNMRGDDIACSPVVQAYSLITADEAVLFVQDSVLTGEQKAELLADGVSVRGYEEVLSAVEALTAEPVLLDPEKVSFELYHRLKPGTQVLEAENPEQPMKAVKNPAEMAHIREAHKKDGVAMTRFLYWVKHTIGKEKITEVSAAGHLETLRKEQEGYLGPSFETISAYGENAAMCHYVADEESDRTVEPKGFLLVDAGGQYMDGTTDTTRTMAVGPLTEEEKLHYTLVLKGMIGLSKMRFKKGFTGLELDYMARGPLWEHGLDYNHGTGHGVGFLLNVHEPGNFIHWKLPPHMRSVFVEGMLVSNEPGCYVAGSHGVRIENLLLCQEEKEGQAVPFMHFETVTLCPIDLEPVLLEYLDADEKQWLNDYHEKVYEAIGPELCEEERNWLRKVTEAI